MPIVTHSDIVIWVGVDTVKALRPDPSEFTESRHAIALVDDARFRDCPGSELRNHDTLSCSGLGVKVDGTRGRWGLSVHRRSAGLDGLVPAVAGPG